MIKVPEYNVPSHVIELFKPPSRELQSDLRMLEIVEGCPSMKL